ncbi:hypothetical protein [Streptomyces paludis]|uniref:hypothetical protein n=1 Tax=Streptomyces paludis TaxID=2282738 RepID=UPI0022B1F41D|nr:hypothetical protein [Streptomyces paludis]
MNAVVNLSAHPDQLAHVRSGAVGRDERHPGLTLAVPPERLRHRPTVTQNALSELPVLLGPRAPMVSGLR